jgi:bifunctional UDP-N-acetylglucosamine pyrophosphorylase / glucosamine-1-phosphate N-acetyltransferase
VSMKKTDGQRKLAVVILAAEDGRQPMAQHEAGGKPLATYATELARAMAGDATTADADDVLVMAATLPLLRAATLAELVHAHQAGDVAATLLTTGLDEGQREARVGVFRAEALHEHGLALDGRDAQALANVLRDTGASVARVEAADAAELWEADSIAELVAIDASLRAAKASALMSAGVVIYRPETCVIDADVEVEAGAVIEPFVQLLGKTRVAAGARIRSYSVIESCTIGENVVILPGCLLREGVIERGANVGPMTHMRPGCVIGEDVHLGAFVETKKTRLGKGAKAGHLAYLGDTEVGAGTNIGAGVITCNYDGVHKHKTHIGEGAFVGSDSTLVAPVTIGAGSYVGAGSCITKDVPPDALALARTLQVTKDGWAAARRARQSAKK